MARTEHDDGAVQRGTRTNGRGSVSETLGASIRQARHAAGFSVRGLAAKTEVSPSLISQIERGRATPSVATLWAIATQLGIPIGELFNGTEPLPELAQTSW